MNLAASIKTVFLVTVIVGVAAPKAGFAASKLKMGDTSWQILRIGGGGYVTGLDISPDGSTRVVRTDTYGAYILEGAQWRQLVTATSMPPSVSSSGATAQGVYEIRIAPSNSNMIYMNYMGLIFKSTDKGVTFQQTAFAQVAASPNDGYRPNGQKMAVDPYSPDVVYVGTPQNGLFVTQDGGKSWKNVAAIPVSLKDTNGNFPGIDAIAFAPSLGNVNGKTNTIFVYSYGNGVYQSLDGGVSWKLIEGPPGISSAAVSSTGIYYVAAGGHSVWSYTKGAWTQLVTATAGIAAVAVNPRNSDIVAAVNQGGSPSISYDAGATWSGIVAKISLSSRDVPWLAASGIYMTSGGLAFDPLVSNKLWQSAGVGVWYTDVPASGLTWRTPVVWNDQSVGIEQLVTNQVLAPPEGHPILASWDRPFFYIADPDAYPSTYGPVNGSFAAGWSVDYASSDPSFIVGIADWWGVEESGYSTTGGKTWTPFKTYPATLANGKIGGSIAASTPANIVWAPSNNAIPAFTIDGGVTWRPVSIVNVPTTGDTGWGSAYYLRRRIVTADRVTPRTFYMYNYLRGLYRSSDGGVTWFLVHAHEIAPWSTFNAKLESVPGHAGELFFTSGPQGGPKDRHPAESPLMRSINGGVLWSAVPGVLEVSAFGFGKALTIYPAIYIVGWVHGTYGLWRSDDNAQSWVQISDFPLGSLDSVTTIEGDKNVYGRVYLGFGGSGSAYGFLEK